MNRSNRRNRGFTLVEFAVSVAIMGIFMNSSLYGSLAMTRTAQIKQTQANMKHVVEVLAIYAQRNNRIPCPADLDPENIDQPTGAEVGSGVDGTLVPAISLTPPKGCRKGPSGGFNEGIVPYRTLGLSKQDVLDGYGNYLTYRVNPLFARDPTDPTSVVHNRCRVQQGTSLDWVVAGANVNPARARFCCGGMGNAAVLQMLYGISIKNAAGVSIWDISRDATVSHYDSVDTAYTAQPVFDPFLHNVTFIAFVLVSHGDRGGGAFTGGGRQPADMSTGAGEAENFNGDNVFVSDRRVGKIGIAHYDDTVVWRTQDQIYADTSSGSCSVPW